MLRDHKLAKTNYLQGQLDIFDDYNNQIYKLICDYNINARIRYK